MRARPSAAQSLRRRAKSVAPGTDGWDVLEVEFGDVEALAEELVGLGAGVLAVEPDELRDVRGAPAARRSAEVSRVSESATERLSRLLAMVPWLLAHQGVPLADAAAEFGVDERQLVKDLELLFVCGLPGHLPDDLIEADWEEGFVYLGNADAISRPLRLGRGRGAGPDRRAAHPDGRARGRRPRRRPARAGQAGGRGRRGRASRPASVRVDLGRVADADVLTTAEEALRAAPPDAPGLPGAAPRRDHRARRRPDAGAARGRPLVPGGLVPPRRGRAAVPAGPGGPARSILDVDGTPPAEAQRPRPGRGTCSRPARTTTSSRWRCARRPAGSSTTTRWTGSTEDGDGGLVVTLRTGDLAWLRQLALRLGGSGRDRRPARARGRRPARWPSRHSQGYGERES